MGPGVLPESPAELKGWGFVCALPRECATLTGARRPVGSLWAFVAGAQVVVTGMGAAAAAAGAQRLVDEGACGLVSWGTCGGLDPRLRPGDIVVATVVTDGTGCQYAVDESWSRHVQGRASGPVVRGPLVTAAAMVAGVDAKKALRARSGACAVDMESAAIAKVAVQCGRPFMVIRAVVDAADAALPQAIAAAVRSNGDLAWAVFFRHLGWSWRAWQDVAVLARSAHAAERALRALARDVVPC